MMYIKVSKMSKFAGGAMVISLAYSIGLIIVIAITIYIAYGIIEKDFNEDSKNAKKQLFWAGVLCILLAIAIFAWIIIAAVWVPSSLSPSHIPWISGLMCVVIGISAYLVVSAKTKIGKGVADSVSWKKEFMTYITTPMLLIWLPLILVIVLVPLFFFRGSFAGISTDLFSKATNTSKDDDDAAAAAAAAKGVTTAADKGVTTTDTKVDTATEEIEMPVIKAPEAPAEAPEAPAEDDEGYVSS